MWGKENGYWKIVSWQSGATDDGSTPRPDPVAEPKIVRISADPSFVQAARGFLESWLIRKDYDAAFGYFSAKSYACYTLERSEGEPAIASPEEGGRQLRARLKDRERRLGRSETSTTSSKPLSCSIQQSA
jgi:hypothetical protein